MSAALIKKSQWYWNRLSCMTPPELVHRVHNTLYAQLQKSGLFLDKDVPNAEITNKACVWLNMPDALSSDYCKSADLILSGYLSIFECSHIYVGHPPVWNKNPRSEHLSPLTFGKTLDYRNEALVGDIKYLWEPSRHLHLVTIAQAYAVSGDDKYLEAIKVQLSSWFEQCPYMMGVHWSSSLELGIRLINWSVVWQLIGGTESTLFSGSSGKTFLHDWLASIYQHTRFITGHYSRFSSANNHLMGEASGVFVAALTWPYWKDNEPLIESAQKIIEQEVENQIAPDGGDREQTTSYQQFVLQFLLICGVAANKTGYKFSENYWRTIERMIEFIAAMMDREGNVPMIGDADDGYVVRLSQEPQWNPYRSLLGIGSILFDRDDFASMGGQVDDQCRWLIDREKYASAANKTMLTWIKSSKRFGRVQRDLEITSFPDSGYYIMTHRSGMTNEVKVIIDCGPLGYQGIAAHGHADALSLVLNYGGLEFLVDPGTYAYHTKKKWREYFRGTSAHNTVRVDGVSQSVSGGNFMWTHKAEADCSQWESGDSKDIFTGQHNGYQRLDDPVTHIRTITFNKVANRIDVVDRLECNKEHRVDLFWNFDEHCIVEKNTRMSTTTKEGVSTSAYIASNQDRKIGISINGKNVITSLHRGEELPPLGWVSRQYGKKVPSSTLKCSGTITGTTEIKTLILL
ncbi:heparinase II/III family protein [Alkalimarinus coralli]|uniref:heparinase II/III family protein n=1 Tax=Alkalimarinus coralli TaxID=2935863 RepID=UPI00202AD04E|nr:alginate lyase family protein [Alkalimarinus coralli]